MEPIWALSFILLWALVLLNLLLTLGLVRRMNAAFPRRDLLKAGQPAPDFKAETLQGETVTLATYAGRSAAFVFISHDCQPCRAELPGLEALRPTAEQNAIALILVSDADAETTQKFVDEAHVNLPMLVAPRGSNPFFAHYKVRGTPSYCLIEPDGKVRAADVGLMDFEELLSNKRAS